MMMTMIIAAVSAVVTAVAVVVVVTAFFFSVWKFTFKQNFGHEIEKKEIQSTSYLHYYTKGKIGPLSLLHA